MELNEKTFELVVSEKSLGTLTTNALQIKEKVLEILPKYDIANYNESNIDQAKKDKALLNSSAKFLNDKRIELEKEWLKPFNEFKDIITETNSLIKDCTNKIDSVVKESETKEKQEKNQKIEDYWNGLEFNLFPLSKIYDDKWLNKTASLKKIFEEINSKIDKTKADLQTLETSFPEDADLLKSMYLDKLDLSETLQYTTKLNENRKKIEEAKPKPTEPTEEPKTFEQAAEITEDAIWEDSEHFEVEKNIISTDPTGFSRVDYENQPPVAYDDEVLTRFMKVVATKEKLIALGDWMLENGIYFEKLEINDNLLQGN